MLINIWLGSVRAVCGVPCQSLLAAAAGRTKDSSRSHGASYGWIAQTHISNVISSSLSLSSMYLYGFPHVILSQVKCWCGAFPVLVIHSCDTFKANTKLGQARTLDSLFCEDCHLLGSSIWPASRFGQMCIHSPSKSFLFPKDLQRCTYRWALGSERGYSGYAEIEVTSGIEVSCTPHSTSHLKSSCGLWFADEDSKV